MWYQRLADLVVVVHFGFVLFVVLGGFLVLRRPRLALLHLPAAVWGILIEGFGWVCPLTPLENHLRRLAGDEGYPGSFIDHYITSLLYPSGLTRTYQLILGGVVLALNLFLYARLIGRLREVRAS
jgi:hypothetical protein